MKYLFARVFVKHADADRLRVERLLFSVVPVPGSIGQLGRGKRHVEIKIEISEIEGHRLPNPRNQPLSSSSVPPVIVTQIFIKTFFLDRYADHIGSQATADDNNKP